MSVNMAEAEDASARAFAGEQTLDGDGVVAVQGWAPADRCGDVRDFAGQHDLACLIEDPGPDDDPPTLLDNPPALAAGTDLSLFYQVPGYRTWDPSIILLFSFALFFGMIVGIPGLGRYFVQGALNRDYTLVMGVVIFYAVLIVILNLIVDLLYPLLDPRVRYD